MMGTIMVYFTTPQTTHKITTKNNNVDGFIMLVSSVKFNQNSCEFIKPSKGAISIKLSFMSFSTFHGKIAAE